MSVAASVDPILERPSAQDVRSLARTGALWTVSLVVGRHAISMAATAVLARLLSASDYGLIGMVMTLTAFFEVFSDIGLSWATIQRQEITRAQVDNLFWINVTAGGVFWGVCALCGPLLNTFYREPHLSSIAALLGAGFLLSSLTVQPMALLRRRMQFKSLSVIEITAHAAASIFAVVLVFHGFGYWALVAQALAAQLMLAILLFACSSYRPSLPSYNSEMRGVITFGSYLAAYGLVNYFARNLDNVLVGRFWGAEQLGYYSRAYFLMMLPALITTGCLTGVIVPALCALWQEGERMGQTYRHAVRVVAGLGFPLAVGLAVTAPETVRLIYGERWAPVVPILFWLSIAGVFQPVYTTMGWLFVSSGKSREMFAFGVAAALILSFGFFIGVLWGPIGVAISYAILMTFVVTIPALYFAHRAAALPLGPTLRGAAPFLVAAIVMGLIVGLAGFAMRSLGSSWGTVLIAKIALGAVTYAMLCGRRVVQDLRQWEIIPLSS